VAGTRGGEGGLDERCCGRVGGEAGQRGAEGGEGVGVDDGSGPPAEAGERDVGAEGPGFGGQSNVAAGGVGPAGDVGECVGGINRRGENARPAWRGKGQEPARASELERSDRGEGGLKGVGEGVDHRPRRVAEEFEGEVEVVGVGGFEAWRRGRGGVIGERVGHSLVESDRDEQAGGRNRFVRHGGGLSGRRGRFGGSSLCYVARPAAWVGVSPA